MLACTYARNASTLKERIECEVFAGLLYVLSPAAIAKLIASAKSTCKIDIS